MPTSETQTASGSKAYLALIAGSGARGGLLFGYDTAVISGAIGFLKEHFHLAADMTGWAASILLKHIDKRQSQDRFWFRYLLDGREDTQMGDDKLQDGMQRRAFLGLASTVLFGAMGTGTVALKAQQGAKGPKKRFRVVDTHLHTFNTTLQGTNGIPYYYPDATIEYLLSVMDKGMVDKAFLITYNAEDVSLEMRGRGASPVVLKAVANHEYQFKSWQAHKDRFWWFADGVNPIHEDYLENLERDFDRGASGVKLLTLAHGLLPDHPAWLPVYELCQRRRKPIIIDWSWWYRGLSYGYGVNESKERQDLFKSYRTFADWVKPMDPIFDKYASVPISLAHCGTPKGRDDYEHIFAFMARHANCHCDLAAIPDYNPWFIGQLVKAVGVRKIMYGTDIPYWGIGTERYLGGPRRWGVIADGCFFLSDEEKQLILAGNAERFVKYELP